MAKQFTLGKNERLKSRKAIEQLFKEGKSFVVDSFRICYNLEEKLTQSPSSIASLKAAVKSIQFGAGVSTKHFKKAVDRNRIKRLIREAWRLQKSTLVNSSSELNKPLTVFFIYNGKELPLYKNVFDTTGKAILKLQAIITAKN